MTVVSDHGATSPVGGDAALREYRQRARAWLSAHVPSDGAERAQTASREQFVEFQRSWLRTLHEGGYAAPHWPREAGGSGATLAEQLVLAEEMVRARAPSPALYFVALNHVAATLTAYGTPRQREHLGGILEGEVWCQGFSEPGAGSDLASLQTRAVRDGDRYVVNGQKVWSSFADLADWCILLARTDPSAPKRRGISFFLLDMRADGVEVRPIRQMTGHSEFCEVFLTDVSVPVEDRVGEENGGWQVAQLTLSTERGPAVLNLSERLRASLVSLIELAQRTSSGLEEGVDASVRQAVAGYYSEVEILRQLCGRMLRNLLATGGVGPEASVIKLYYSELLQRLTRFGVELEGLPGQLASEVGWLAASDGPWLTAHLSSWAWTIAGGSSEIQRNLIGERVLGLPREPGAS